MAKLININKRINAMSQPRLSQTLMQSGFKLVRLLRENYNKGLGADDKRMPALSTRYRNRKISGKIKGISGRGRVPFRNLTLKGNMLASMKPRKVSGTKILVSFSGAELKKARGNVKHARNMMSVGKRIENNIIFFVFKELTT